MNYQISLATYLLKLKPSGPDGFEGLVAQLLSQLTSLHFRLAKSGYQAGRDLGTREWQENIIAVETKRYGTTELNNRELLGEIAQARRETPDLDLWVLVTTRDMGDALLIEQLTDACHEFGIEFLSLSGGEEGIGTLDILCATAPDVVLRFLEGYIEPIDEPKVRQQLAVIRGNDEFEERVERLRQQLTSPNIGYASWAQHQRKTFLKRLKTKEESRAAFGQILNVAGEEVHFIERRTALHAYDSWLANWEQSKGALVVLGDEGDGKTWSVAAWLKKRIESSVDFPPVLFIPSAEAVSAKGLQELILEHVKSPFHMLSQAKLEYRLARWLDHPSPTAPRFLLVLDGINEKGAAQFWRGLFDEASAPPTYSQIGVIVTCRTKYWQRYFSEVPALIHREYQLPSFSDHELSAALSIHNLTRSEISENLLPLIRKPRYFDLLIKHREKVEHLNEVTPDRLIYEDWRDRIQRKKSLTDLPHEDFQLLIRDLAAEHLNRTQHLREREIERFLPSGVYVSEILSELRTSEILEGSGSHVRVNKIYLIYGFGLLLVEELESAWATEPTEHSIRQALAKALEPHPDMDLKAEICAFAALHALYMSVPREICVLLLEAWIQNRNAPETTEEDFTAYIPLDPYAYSQLAEQVWQAEIDNNWIQELLLKGFLRWKDSPPVLRVLKKVTEKWLGFVHPHGFFFQRGENEVKSQEVREKIEQKIGRSLEPGPFEFAGYQLTVIEDDGLLRLGHFSLAIISHIPRATFVKSLTIGILAEAVMGLRLKEKVYRWIFSIAVSSLWNEVEREADQLLKANTRTTYQAAYWLLSYEASPLALALRASIPNGIFGRSSFLQQHLKDPCTSGLTWNEEEQRECLGRPDVPAWQKVNNARYRLLDPTFDIPSTLHQQVLDSLTGVNHDEVDAFLAQSSADIELEKFEPVLLRTSLYAYSTFIKDLVQHIDQRQGVAVQALAMSLARHLFLFKDSEYSAIYRAWLRTTPNSAAIDKQNETNEYYLFDYVLEFLSGEGQLLHTLHRHTERLDPPSYHARFRLLGSGLENIVATLPLITEQVALRRVLHYLIQFIEELAPQHLEQYWLPLLQHDDSFIRSLIFKGLYISQKSHVIGRYLDKQDWGWQPHLSNFENRWGSLLLARYGQRLPLHDLFKRVHPIYWGNVIFYRECQEQDVKQLAEMLDELLHTVEATQEDVPDNLPPANYKAHLDPTKDLDLTHRLEVSRSDISTSFTGYSFHSSWGGLFGDFDAYHSTLQESLNPDWYSARRETFEKVRQSQLSAGNPMFFTRVSPLSFSSLVLEHPQLIDKWLASVLQDTTEANQLLRKGQAFFQALCEVLLQEMPEKGLNLYSRLSAQDGLTNYTDPTTGINLLDIALFKAPSEDLVTQVWRAQFETCKTDLELFELAFVAQQGNARQLLREWIKADLSSTAPRNFALALTLVGMLDSDRGNEIVWPREQPVNTWREELAKVTLERSEINIFAKHWFRYFLIAENDEQAWGAFGLFLRCVDRRFWLWNEELLERECERKVRIRFLKLNLDTIEKSIKRNESRLFKDKLFGQKTIPRQVWPWI